MVVEDGGQPGNINICSGSHDIYIAMCIYPPTQLLGGTHTLALTGAKASNIDWHLLGGNARRYNPNKHLQMESISTYISDSPRNTCPVICSWPIANLSIIGGAIYASLLSPQYIVIDKALS